jgi:hypothetical protein
VAARAQTPELAGEGDQELVPAVRAADPGDALVEDAAIEVAVDCRLDAGSQVAVTSLEPRLICAQEPLEVVSECPVEEGVLGMARAVDAGSCSRCDRLHSEEKTSPGARVLRLLAPPFPHPLHSRSRFSLAPDPGDSVALRRLPPMIYTTVVLAYVLGLIGIAVYKSRTVTPSISVNLPPPVRLFRWVGRP